VFVEHNPNIYFINIATFMTYLKFEGDQYYNYDLREPKRKILNPDKLRETKNTVASTDNWTNIPYYPTTSERRENVAKHLLSMGKIVPDNLIKQIENDKRLEVQADNFNRNIIPQPQQRQQPPPPPQRQQQQQQQQQRQQQQLKTIPHKFSQEYAQAVGQKPRAQASARIGLGGVF
jgi:hypothetical protein